MEKLRRDTYLLYRHILKAHSIYLKEDMRVFGDFFVKTEFHLHYSNGNEEQMKQFITNWKQYYTQISNNNISTDLTLKNKLDLDQMKSLKDIEATINKNI
jgi:hypothetical protein